VPFGFVDFDRGWGLRGTEGLGSGRGDHKLITRLYNNIILRAIENEITCPQTAYKTGHNISENFRLLGAAVKLGENEDDITESITALDAQRRFDSVNYQYVIALLNRTRQHNYVQIFKLSYKDLRNDIRINGKIGNGYGLGNGVKQGHSLSCSLFILAIEPLLGIYTTIILSHQ